MRRYLRDRLAITLLIIWAAVTLAFFVLRILPGDALTAQMLQGGADTAELEARRGALGLDAPPLLQYVRYIAGLPRGDFGYSFITQQPVGAILGEQFSATLSLGLGALAAALIIGLGLGITEAAAGSRWPGQLAGTISVLALSTPIFWTGTLAIFVFSTWLGWLPATGSGDLRHLLLPVLVLGFHIAGSIARVTQTSLHSALTSDIVRTARAKGLRSQRVFLHHAFRLSLPPIIAIIALQIGFLLGGTVIIETLFARRGLGQLLHDAVLNQDYPVVQGVVVLSAAVYSLANTAADLLHAIIDPRVRSGEEA